MKKNKVLNSILCVLALSVLSACNTDNSKQNLVTQSNVVATHGLYAHSSEQQNFKDVAYGNGVYITVGSKGAIYTSTNMKHWFEQTGITTKNINGVVFNPVRKKFYAVGDDGLMLSSADGVSWTEYQTLSPSVRLNSINVLANGNGIIGGDSGNIFELVLDKDDPASDKVVNRKFYNAASPDSTSSVNAVVGGNDFMLAGNSAGISDLKVSNEFDTAEWKYHGKIADVSISDIYYDSSIKYFHAVLSNGTVANLGASKQTNKWTIPVCVAHKGSGECLVGATTNSIATDQSSYNLLVVGGGADTNHTFVSNSEDSNSWEESAIPNTSKLNKVRCFGDSKKSQCLAVGDQKSLVIINVENNKVKWTKVNITAPELTATYPENESSFANTAPDMQLSFNIPVKDVNDKTVTVYEDHIGGTKVNMNTFLPSQNQEIYTAAPISKFKELTKYVVVVESGITDAEDMPIKAKTFTFTTGDFTAPEMVVINPEKGSEGITLTPNIQLKFSKAVTNANSSTISLREGSDTGANVPISNLEPQLDNGYTFNVKDKLKSLTKYCVVGDSTIEDKYHNRLTRTQSCFDTGDYIAPTVTMINPLENSTDASIDSAIELKFSKTVQNVDTKNISIHKGSKTGPTIAIKNINNNGLDYVITPTGRLPHNTSYYVVLESAITDTTPNENKLQTTVFNFKTMEQVITIDPLPPTAANGMFILNMHTTISEDVQVTLPEDFTADTSTKVACIANEVCQLQVNVGAMAGVVLPDTFQIKADGIDTKATAETHVVVSGMPTMAVFSSNGINNNSRGRVEICKVEKDSLSGCQISDSQSFGATVGEIYGSKISSSGEYIYLMTGKQTATNLGDGIYKCKIDKKTFAVTGCQKQTGVSSTANTRTLLLSPDGKYAYYDQMNNDASKGNNQTIDKCEVAADASLFNCKAVTNTAFDTKIERMVMSDSGRNIYVNIEKDPGVKICEIDKATGDFINKSCKDAGSGTPKGEWGITMGLDNSVMYFLGGSGMKSCARDKNTYALSGCSSVYDTKVIGATGLAITRNYALVTNYQQHVAYKCTFAVGKRTFTGCSELTGVAKLKELEAVDIFQ